MQTIQSFKFKSPKLIYSPVWFVCWADSALWLPVNQALCKRSIHDPWFWVSECERNSNLQISISTQQLRSSCSSGQQADEPQPWPSLHKGLNGSVAHHLSSPTHPETRAAEGSLGAPAAAATKRSLSITSLSLEMSRCLSDCSLESTKMKLEVGISNFWSPCAVSDVSRGWQFNRGVRSVMFVPETSKLSSMGMAQISSRPPSSRSVQARESFFKPRSMLKEACSDASPYRRKPSISSVWRPCLQSLLDVRLWRTSEIVRSLCICDAFSSWSLWGQSESLKASAESCEDRM